MYPEDAGSIRLFVWNVCCVVHAAVCCCSHKCYLIHLLSNIYPSNIYVVGSFTGDNIEGVATYDGVSPGHNLSQADATSLEGEAPATTGCYRQYEHAISDKIPQSTDPNQVRATAILLGASA